MEKDDSIKIAKSKKSDVDKLKGLLGISDEIDLLLAKHPNTSAEMLDDICYRQSFNEKICGTALAHPNISAEQLLNVGWEYPLAMFRNPALPSLMQSRKNFLGEFSGEEFENAFKKDLPAFVVDWLLSQGRADYQVIFVSAPKRAPEVLERFRESKYSKVVVTLLDKDVSTYLAWAKDLGFVAAANERLVASEMRSCIDAWLRCVVGKNSDFFAGGVALSEPCASLPKVLLNVLKPIEDMYFKCGRVAFSESANFYVEFVRLLQDTLTADATFTKLVKRVIDFDLEELKRFGSPVKKALAEVSQGSYYAKSGLEKSFNRILAVLTCWSGKQSEARWMALGKALSTLVVDHPSPNVPESLTLAGTLSKPQSGQDKKLVAQPLEMDERAYLAWATDLGFMRPMPDADEPASLKAKIDDWVTALADQNTALWTALVPETGNAPSLQGELVRALGRIEAEHFKNGMMNWGDGSGYYENLTKLIHTTLKSEATFSKLVQKTIDADIGEIKKSGQVGRAIARGLKPREAAFDGTVLVQCDVEKSHQRLGALITVWCQRNLAPIPFEEN